MKPLKCSHSSTGPFPRRQYCALGLSFLLLTLIPGEQFGNSVGFIWVSRWEFSGGCCSATLPGAHPAALRPQALRSSPASPPAGPGFFPGGRTDPWQLLATSFIFSAPAAAGCFAPLARGHAAQARVDWAIGLPNA